MASLTEVKMKTPFKKNNEIRRVRRNRVTYNGYSEDTGGHRIGTSGFNIQKKIRGGQG